MGEQEQWLILELYRPHYSEGLEQLKRQLIQLYIRADSWTTHDAHTHMALHASRTALSSTDNNGPLRAGHQRVYMHNPEYLMKFQAGHVLYVLFQLS